MRRNNPKWDALLRKEQKTPKNGYMGIYGIEVYK